MKTATMSTSHPHPKQNDANIADDDQPMSDILTNSRPQLPLPEVQTSSKTENIAMPSTATPKYIKPRKPADPLIRPKRVPTATARPLDIGMTDSSPLGLINPSNDKPSASLLSTMLSHANLNGGQPCAQCEARKADLELSKRQMEDQKLLHRLKLAEADQKNMKEKLIWKEERNRLREQVSVAAIRSGVREHLHMASSEHESIVGDLNEEIEVVYRMNWELECDIEELKDRLMKYEPDFVKSFVDEQVQLENPVSESISLSIETGDIDVSPLNN